MRIRESLWEQIKTILESTGDGYGATEERIDEVCNDLMRNKALVLAEFAESRPEYELRVVDRTDTPRSEKDWEGYKASVLHSENYRRVIEVKYPGRKGRGSNNGREVS